MRSLSRRKKKEGRRKKEEGRRKKEEGRRRKLEPSKAFGGISIWRLFRWTYLTKD
ncbi:MAG: hypothetical protein HC849_11355 [Oscillatoriales cyanobacterium RU_3_3]|nr:hypothetical protein [Oscillatoriales cyanobacterium RU_3_3]